MALVVSFRRFVIDSKLARRGVRRDAAEAGGGVQRVQRSV